MEKEQFLAYVMTKISAHPEWFKDMINVTQAAILERLSIEQLKRSESEAVVLSLYDKVYKGDNTLALAIKDKAEIIIKDAYKGSAYASKI